jgi:hypothetical protein
MPSPALLCASRSSQPWSMAVTTSAPGVPSGRLTNHYEDPSAEPPWRDGVEPRCQWHPGVPASAIRAGDDIFYISCHCHTNRGRSVRVYGSPRGWEDVCPRLTSPAGACARPAWRAGLDPRTSGRPTGVALHRRPRISGAERRSTGPPNLRWLHGAR